ncbi:histidine--tRNA ligase [Fulvivirga sedimenti]|uniref:Histidine--tRNA ligase n=1 Tax=Fulvivirga sedimenti TaxID=2879465 RepID=A0A9X1HQN1_9BACT|nr:histidine--tRNA ligase [Fulvivirga sedimenti]MCA6075381.1 histidine--tRNA ligase [Fulvivirga sedimenti]MCA6076558.1 histidine--tRNA ligase [Fulvivirga sedimenti]MCA6077686.1 histidine--tRNA ligase [Fulvivirga sedimenti]
MSSKPSLPKGTRDFGPEEMARRNYILDIIRGVFRKFGFMPLETPAMENLDVLTGKYGDEGDQLLYKILNSGDFLSRTTESDYRDGSRHFASLISEKGLKYDLTVPFARYVVMNQHKISMPFKRYQIQPVWRADRPQRGRYREFQQCDADVVGTDSLLCEAEVIWMIREVFNALGIIDYSIRINHRKILQAIAEAIGAPGKESELCVAIDKLDKIGSEKVIQELTERGFTAESTSRLKPLLNDSSANLDKMEQFIGSGNSGISDVREVFDLIRSSGMDHVDFDPLLARGLSYYTGCIFEVKVNNVSVGSVSGGGRYDDLTGVFGLPGLSGIGFSFGVDRLYDVMEELSLFPESANTFTTALIVAFDQNAWSYGLEFLRELRTAGIHAELYPEVAKAKKQFSYADKKNIPFVLVAGESEMEKDGFSLKNMKSGEQELLSKSAIIEHLISFNGAQ